jgi:hypothetical protein
MPRFDNFDDKIKNIYKNFMNKKNIKLKKTYLDNRHIGLLYHMHPNRRLKKMIFIYPYNIRSSGIEAKMPLFTVTLNKINKNNKNKFLCIYNNFYEGGIKEIKLNFSDIEDDKNIKYNIKELQKVIKIIQYGFNELNKNLGKIDYYKQ